MNGGLEYCAKLRKFFGVPKPRARVANTLPKDYFLNLKRKGQVKFGERMETTSLQLTNYFLFIRGTGRHDPGRLHLCAAEDGVALQVGLGVTYLSGTDDILTGVVAQKQFFFGQTLNPFSLKVKAQADYNTQTQQVTTITPAWKAVQGCMKVFCWPRLFQTVGISCAGTSSDNHINFEWA